MGEPIDQVVAAEAAEGNPLRKKALDLLRTKFLDKAKEPGAEEKIETELDAKLDKVERGGGRIKRELSQVVAQLKIVWAHRAMLERKHYLLLAAALLYFLSPIDVIPDPIPVIGYADDVVVLGFVLGVIINAIPSLKQKVQELKDGILDDAANRGKEAAREVMDEALQKANQAAELAVQRSIAGVATGIWGMTSAAAVSLAVYATTGSVTVEWAIYILVVAGLVGIWNMVLGVRTFLEFRRLDSNVQKTLAKVFASKLVLRHAVIVGAPIVLLAGLGVARFLMLR